MTGQGLQQGRCGECIQKPRLGTEQLPLRYSVCGGMWWVDGGAWDGQSDRPCDEDRIAGSWESRRAVAAFGFSNCNTRRYTPVSPLRSNSSYVRIPLVSLYTHTGFVRGNRAKRTVATDRPPTATQAAGQRRGQGADARRETEPSDV